MLTAHVVYYLIKFLIHLDQKRSRTGISNDDAETPSQYRHGGTIMSPPGLRRWLGSSVYDVSARGIVTKSDRKPKPWGGPPSKVFKMKYRMN